MSSELPQGAEWAVAPLLDEANIGRYVWHIFNSNDKWASVHQIVKIGRTNVHVETNRAKPESLRVDRNGETASGVINDFGVVVQTEQWRQERKVRADLISQIRGLGFTDASTDALRQVVILLGGEVE